MPTQSNILVVGFAAYCCMKSGTDLLAFSEIYFSSPYPHYFMTISIYNPTNKPLHSHSYSHLHLHSHTIGWEFDVAFYFAAYTSSSVGYGDMSLQSNSSIIFNICYILLSVSLTGIAFEKLANLKRHINEMELDQLMNAIELSDDLIDAIAPSCRHNGSNGRGTKVSSAEYILHMLILAGKVDQVRRPI